jgi:hypothetical protein
MEDSKAHINLVGKGAENLLEDQVGIGEKAQPVMFNSHC